MILTRIYFIIVHTYPNVQIQFDILVYTLLETCICLIHELGEIQTLLI